MSAVASHEYPGSSWDDAGSREFVLILFTSAQHSHMGVTCFLSFFCRLFELPACPLPFFRLLVSSLIPRSGRQKETFFGSLMIISQSIEYSAGTPSDGGSNFTSGHDYMFYRSLLTCRMKVISTSNSGFLCLSFCNPQMFIVFMSKVYP